MKLPVEERARLEKLCNQFRIDVIDTLHQRQTGHPGGSLSVTEILTTLYFEEMNVDPADPQKADRDRLILCKGHTAPMLYRVLAEKGFFPVEEMKTLRCLNSRLQGHPCPLDTPGVDAATGPLGIGAWRWRSSWITPTPASTPSSATARSTRALSGRR